MMMWYNWVIIDIILEVISFWTRRNAMNFIARKNKQIRSVKGHCTLLVRSLQSTLAGHSQQVCTYNEKLIYKLSLSSPKFFCPLFSPHSLACMHDVLCSFSHQKNVRTWTRYAGVNFTAKVKKLTISNG